jgi:hypothetical protein
MYILLLNPEIRNLFARTEKDYNTTSVTGYSDSTLTLLREMLPGNQIMVRTQRK